MAWYTLADAQGRRWSFDPDGAAHIIRSSQYNRELVLRSRTVQRSHGFLMPTTTEVETNFNGIRAAVQNNARASIDQLSRDVVQDPRRLYEWLVDVRTDGERAGDAHQQMVRSASRASAQAINQNVDRWENALAAAKFVRDASAGILFVGATVITGGAAFGATVSGGVAFGGTAAAATALTFTGNTQDNLASNQTMRQAMGNAAISTGFAVVTNLLIPKGLGAVGRGITGVNAAGQAARNLTMGENVVLGLISVQANIAADMAKTALTADNTAGPVSREAAAQLQRQIGARTGFEVSAMLFQSWLASRGIPAVAMLERNADAVNSVAGGMLAAAGDRIVAAISQQGQQGAAARHDLDMAFTQIARIASAEQYVRQTAMRPE